SRVSTAPLFVYDREALLSLLPSAKLDATLTGEVQAFLNLIGHIPATEVGVPSVLTDELLRFDPAATVGAVGTLPNGYVDQNDGVVLYRQNWTDPNATMLVFRSGPMAESHSGLDANSLRIWKGGYWLTGDANIYSASGIQQLSDKFNTLTVGGRSQSHHDGPALLSNFLSDTLVSMQGQAASGYLLPGSPTGNQSNVLDYRRSVTYLPDVDAFVIVDRVSARDSTQSKVFRWHSKAVPMIAGNTFTLTQGTQRCVGALLTSATLGLQAFKLGNDTSVVTSNAVTVTVGSNPTVTL